MGQSEIIEIEREAIKKFCRGDRKLALKVIQRCGESMREYFNRKHPRRVTSDELYAVIENEAGEFGEYLR